MMMRALWRHIQYNYDEGGIRQVLYKTGWRFQQWLWSQSAWLVYHVDVAQYRLEPALPLRHSRLGFDALRQLQYFKAMAFPEMVRTRLDSGASCNGFFLKDELANIAWTTRGYLEIEHGVTIREDRCVGIFDCYTLPQHRSKGIYTDTLIRLIRNSREEGATLALIGVDPDNYASINGIERAGFEPFYRLTRRRRFGRQFFVRSKFEARGRSAGIRKPGRIGVNPRGPT
jgi:GNAT superfamily N-acetyltransferase